MPIYLILAGLVLWGVLIPFQAPPPNDRVIFQNKTTITARIGSTSYNLEIADSTRKRGQGLSWRGALPADQGMLFLFDQPGRYEFIMGGMRFPLDFIWLNNGLVVDLKENVPPLKANQPSINFTAKNNFDQAIELNAGEIKKNGLKPGDRIAYF